MLIQQRVARLQQLHLPAHEWSFANMPYQRVSGVLQGCGVLLQGGPLLQHAQQGSVVQEALQLLCGGITCCTAAPHSCTHTHIIDRQWKKARVRHLA